VRVARFLWLLLFAIPLGVFADRFCYISSVDPLYHGLMWLHERLPLIFAVLGAASALAAGLRFSRIQGQLRALEMVRSTPPAAVREAFQQTRDAGTNVEIVYVDVANVFCFTAIRDRVILSRGFVDLLDGDEFVLVAKHEAAHIVRADPLRALLWHIFFAALIVPGFERLEEILYARRERMVDLFVARTDPATYGALLARFSTTMCGTPGAAFRAPVAREGLHLIRALAPAAIPIALLAFLVTSHVLFVQNLPYLRLHHC
jgi:Zn-dependent protease with chaperone function